ncbi:MAG: peptidoglycan DD-metalloendopeptidase family protein [Acutalibacteraceae bacterium]|nr:peptidoglycan DD-metalloendopeptidase family protein [Acutalibacteraceae bacterium]
MKLTIIKIIAVFCCVVLFSTVAVIPQPVSVNAASSAQEKYNQAKKDLDDAKSKKAAQDKIKAALDKKISATQALISECNSKIASLNSKISTKQAEIDAKNKQIEADKEQFRKRVRAIYMSGSQSNVQILLGAENFSEFLILAEMTSNLSARDNELIEKINESISAIKVEQAEIQTLVDEQKSVKQELTAQKKELDSDVKEVNAIINGLKSDIAAAQKTMEETSKQINQGSSGNKNISFAGGFLWPVAGHYYISAGWKSNDNVHKGKHGGIDIAGGGISGKPVRASADGIVYISKNGCDHNYGKSKSCGCGGGYGNYVAIDHGKNSSNGKTYKTLYAHMSKAIVSNGANVKKGDIIGYVGSTGWSTGYHLHYEIIENGEKKNPLNYSFDK